MPMSIRFYRDLLGFTVVSNSPALSQDPDDVNWVMLRCGDSTVMLNTAYEPEFRPSVPEPERFGGHSDTGLFFACPDVDGVYDHLLSKGLKVNPPKVAPYGMKQLSLSDPDGYGLCFQWTA